MSSDDNAADGRQSAGFTLIELMICVAIIGILAAIAVPMFLRLGYQAQVARAILDIKAIGNDVDIFELDKGRFPVSLTEIGRGGIKDPWGNPYVYMSFSDPDGKGKARKDHSLHPLNTYYDLYSKGEDGASVAPLTAKASRDDIIRANDGGFVGLGSDY